MTDITPLGDENDAKELTTLSSFFTDSSSDYGASSQYDALPVNVIESNEGEAVEDSKKRHFLKILGGGALGVAAAAMFPSKASALVVGSTPTSNVVGLKNSSNTRINPATDDTLAANLKGQGLTKLTTLLSASGTVRTPAAGKKIRVYSTRFSLDADLTSVSFRFTSGGTDHEKYIAPKTGGLYGANNNPNYIEGGVDQVLYCAISGTANVQINIDYLEI